MVAGFGLSCWTVFGFGGLVALLCCLNSFACVVDALLYLFVFAFRMGALWLFVFGFGGLVVLLFVGYCVFYCDFVLYLSFDLGFRFICFVLCGLGDVYLFCLLCFEVVCGVGFGGFLLLGLVFVFMIDG